MCFFNLPIILNKIDFIVNFVVEELITALLRKHVVLSLHLDFPALPVKAHKASNG